VKPSFRRIALIGKPNTSEIEGALRRWEPRVSLIGVTVDPDDIDERTAIATVRYSLVATRAADQLQLRVSLGG